MLTVLALMLQRQSNWHTLFTDDIGRHCGIEAPCFSELRSHHVRHPPRHGRVPPSNDHLRRALCHRTGVRQTSACVGHESIEVQAGVHQMPGFAITISHNVGLVSVCDCLPHGGSPLQRRFFSDQWVSHRWLLISSVSTLTLLHASSAALNCTEP